MRGATRTRLAVPTPSSRARRRCSRSRLEGIDEEQRPRACRGELRARALPPVPAPTGHARVVGPDELAGLGMLEGRLAVHEGLEALRARLAARMPPNPYGAVRSASADGANNAARTSASMLAAALIQITWGAASKTKPDVEGAPCPAATLATVQRDGDGRGGTASVASPVALPLGAAAKSSQRHDRQQLVHGIGRRHCRDLGMVIGGRDLHHVTADEPQPRESAQYPQQLAS